MDSLAVCIYLGASLLAIMMGMLELLSVWLRGQSGEARLLFAGR